MEARSRERAHDPREDILLETNFDEDGALTMAHSPYSGNYKGNYSTQGTLPLQRGNGRRNFYRSDTSIDRYSEFSLHGRRDRGGNSCQSCMTRIPYATIIATVLCLIGVGIYCFTMYRGASVTIIMFDRVFHFHLFWIEAVRMVFVVIGISMAALGFMILFVGCLATGSTRYKVYRTWRSRVGGRISCAVFMAITYILNIVWIMKFCFLCIVTFIYTVFWRMCSENIEDNPRPCLIDLTQFHFLFPDGIRNEDMKICEKFEVKEFCKDGVEKAEVMFILATLSCLLIILSLIHYLMCLSANYAHIRDHEKFQELQEIQNLNDMEYSAVSKERF